MGSIFTHDLLVFHWESPALLPVFLARKGDSIRDVRMVIDDGFNDPAAYATIGQYDNQTLIMGPSDSNISAFGEYMAPGVFIANNGLVNEAFYMYLFPGASIRGHGRLYYTTEYFQ